MRRFAQRSAIPSPGLPMTLPRRNIALPPSTDILAGHLLGAVSVPSAFGLMGSPWGTMAMVALAYNVSVSGSSHAQYSLDIVARDYIQDTVLYNALRYLVVLSLISLVAQLFIEL